MVKDGRNKNSHRLGELILNPEKSLFIRKIFLRNNLNNNFHSDLYSSSCYHRILTAKFHVYSPLVTQ